MFECNRLYRSHQQKKRAWSSFAGYLKQQDIPLVIVSHDREFLDQLCTKIVETEFGRATTYKGNYTQYVNAKAEKLAQQWAAYEKQQKEIVRQVGLPC